MKKQSVALLSAACFMFGMSSVATAQDTLELLTWKGYAPKSLVEKFESETGIKVNITNSNNEEMIVKLRATRGAGFDLAQPSQDRISSVQMKYKIYQPLDYSKIDDSQIITSMLDAVKKNTKVKGESFAVPHVFGTSGLVINKAKAPDAADYTDLVNNMYEGRVSYRLKRPTLLGLAFAQGHDPFSLYDKPEEYAALMESVGDTLIKNKNVVKNYWSNGDALLDSMRSEEVFVAMAWDNGGWKLHAENEDIDFVAPKSGALGWIDTFVIPAKAKNVDAAYKWINFMLRPENAAEFTNMEKYGTASKGASEFYGAEEKANFDRCFPPAIMDQINWYPPVPANIEAIEGKILDKVKAAKSK